MKTNPFNHDYFIGYVSEVLPQFVRIHFPSSVLLNRFFIEGEEFNGGLVGNFVVIEGESFGFLGKILELSLPETERLRLTERAFQNHEFHPTGKVEVLLSFDHFIPFKISKGLDCYPTIGAKVFVPSSEFLQEYLRRFGLKVNQEEDAPFFDFAVLTSNRKTKVTVSQQALFGRHCAVVGTTGGGKSWTVAKLIEETIKVNGKAIILDATGEYHTMDTDGKVEKSILSDDSFFHYSRLTTDDLFFLMTPSGRVQAPKLMEAVRSLKMVQIADQLDDTTLNRSSGNLIKANQEKKPIQQFFYKHIAQIEDGYLDFDITKLAKQITNECIYDTANNNANNFGGRSENDVSYCVSLISRINNVVNTAIFRRIFGFSKDANDSEELTAKIDTFLKSSNKNILRIGFERVGYELQAREILANAIAKVLLSKARNGEFKQAPLVFFVDEAHQYLNKTLQDEYFGARPLDAFDLIAKECRKYGLFLCLATQMPRDIPIGTLSQMGTFIVHRLINHYDKEAVSSASSSANQYVLSFLPVLGEGEAILMGIDFPMPLSIRVNEPKMPPDSDTPKFCKIRRDLPMGKDREKN